MLLGPQEEAAKVKAALEAGHAEAKAQKDEAGAKPKVCAARLTLNPRPYNI